MHRSINVYLAQFEIITSDFLNLNFSDSQDRDLYSTKHTESGLQILHLTGKSDKLALDTIQK